MTSCVELTDTPSVNARDARSVRFAIGDRICAQITYSNGASIEITGTAVLVRQSLEGTRLWIKSDDQAVYCISADHARKCAPQAAVYR